MPLRTTLLERPKIPRNKQNIYLVRIDNYAI